MPPPPLATLSDYSKPFTDYKDVAREAIKGLISSWKQEQRLTEERRRTRYADIDIEGEKDYGSLDKDEIFTPLYLIDSNIKKEQAKKLAYLTKSPRSVILSCIDDASVDGTPIEKDFTTKARYNEWELDFAKWIDGSDSHAWDTVEVIFDVNKPGHFAVEHIGHENLLFPADSKHIQKADFLVRIIELTPRDLAKLVKEGDFSPEEVNTILGSEKTTSQDGDSNSKNTPELTKFTNRKLEKVFFKHDDGFVYVAWSCAEVCESNWVRKPRKLFLGQIELNPNYNQLDPMSQQYIQLFETSYPVEPLVYSISENECIMQMKGRIDFDTPKQEAATSLLSSALTSFRRSTNQYWVPADGTNDGTAWDESQTDIALIPNRVFQKPLKQLQLTHVDTSVFQAVYMIIGQSQQEAGDTNFAVFSNKSTRKTSAEVKLADKTDSLLSSTGATLLSIGTRNVYTRCFNIYRSRVIAGLIKANDNVVELLRAHIWALKPAGDTDVIERQEKISRMESAWPVYENTPARNEFLKLLTKLLFPDEAPQILKAMEEGEMQLKFIAGMMTVLKSLLIDPTTNQLKQEFVSEGPRLIQMLQQGQQILAQNMSNGNVTPAQPTNNGVNMPQEDVSNVINIPQMQEVSNGS